MGIDAIGPQTLKINTLFLCRACISQELTPQLFKKYKHRQPQFPASRLRVIRSLVTGFCGQQPGKGGSAKWGRETLVA
jgi:hypothetical protein